MKGGIMMKKLTKKNMTKKNVTIQFEVLNIVGWYKGWIPVCDRTA